VTKFIVETDLGHDPDDFFTICHLISAGHEVVAVSLVPGCPEQVKLADLIRSRTGQQFAIGVAKLGAKSERLGVHDKLRAEARAEVEKRMVVLRMSCGTPWQTTPMPTYSLSAQPALVSSPIGRQKAKRSQNRRHAEPPFI
jgi:hypothetical protein